MSTKQCDIKSFFIFSERSLLDLNDTLWCAIFFIQAFEFDLILNSHLSYFLLNIVISICFYTYFFHNITLCITLPNVTSSNMSHLVYITLFGETDGVTLSRLGCIEVIKRFLIVFFLQNSLTFNFLLPLELLFELKNVSAPLPKSWIQNRRWGSFTPFCAWMIYSHTN